jgi:hypothetical protein
MSIQPDLVLAACPVCGDPIVKVAHVQKCVDRLKLDRRGFQVMARKMAAQCLWQPMMDEGKYERAGGDVECPECYQTYVEHPQIPGYPTFHMICRGEIVKT